MVHAMKLPDDIRKFFQRQGRIGAAKRHASLSPERRREIARLAIQTRWAKQKADASAGAARMPASRKSGKTKGSKKSGGKV